MSDRQAQGGNPRPSLSSMQRNSSSPVRIRRTATSFVRLGWLCVVLLVARWVLDAWWGAGNEPYAVVVDAIGTAALFLIAVILWSVTVLLRALADIVERLDA